MAKSPYPLDRLVAHPLNPVPDGAILGHVTTSDGVGLRYARWSRTGPIRRGTVLLLQGRAEFIEKYFEVVSDLRRRGYAVVVFDWRGQGGSQRLLGNPLKGHVESFADHGRDLEAVFHDVVLPDCPPPYTVLAHSTGAAIALLDAVYLRSQVSRLVVTAPLLGLKGRDRLRLERVSSLLSYFGLSEAYVPGGRSVPVQAMPFRVNLVTSDPARYARAQAIVEAEPALGLGPPTVGWINAAMRALAHLTVEAAAERITLPVLVVQSGDERVVDNRPIETLANGLKTVAHVVVPGALHEVMMERDVYREQFWAAFDSFTGISGAPA